MSTSGFVENFHYEEEEIECPEWYESLPLVQKQHIITTIELHRGKGNVAQELEKSIDEINGVQTDL